MTASPGREVHANVLPGAAPWSALARAQPQDASGQDLGDLIEALVGGHEVGVEQWRNSLSGWEEDFSTDKIIGLDSKEQLHQSINEVERKQTRSCEQSRRDDVARSDAGARWPGWSRSTARRTHIEVENLRAMVAAAHGARWQVTD
jgi:hypothetical protein